MQNAMPIILLVMCATLVAVPIAKVIWKPFKQRREKQRYAQWKAGLRSSYF